MKITQSFTIEISDEQIREILMIDNNEKFNKRIFNDVLKQTMNLVIENFIADNSDELRDEYNNNND